MRSYDYEAPTLVVLGPVGQLTLNDGNPPGKHGGECDASAFVAISPPGNGTPPITCMN